MKTSYVHVQTPNGRSLGFSAFLDPYVAADGRVMCEVAITRCNPVDMHFCKRTARENLANSIASSKVAARDVPAYLAEVKHRCTGKKESSAQFNYVLKRFL